MLDRVDTFIGRNDRGEYVKVGSTENVSAPGAIFRYASYVGEQERQLGYYLVCYHQNLLAWSTRRRVRVTKLIDMAPTLL